MISIHIYPSSFENESRIEKQAGTLAAASLFSEIWLVGTPGHGLPSRRKLAPGITVWRVGKANQNRGLFSKALIFNYFYLAVMRLCRGREISCVNAHSLSVLPLAVIIRTLHGAKLIYDTHELETETNGARGLRKQLAKIVERLLIPFADQVFVVSDSIADWYQSSYRLARPVVVLNAPKRFEPPGSDLLRSELGISDDQIIVLYQGSLGYGRGVEILLSAFECRGDDRVVIVFMGYGALEARIKKVAAASGRVFFRSAVTPAEVLNYTASADIGISFIENTCLSYFYCLPNKLFEYAMAGLPVIVSNMKEMRNVVQQHEIGLVVEEQNVDSINQAIDRLLDMDLNRLKKNAREFALSQAWEVQEVAMLNAYHSIGISEKK